MRPRKTGMFETSITYGDLELASAAVFDELFGLCDSGKPLPAAFLHEMNATQERLVAQYRPEAANERDDPRQEE